MKQWTERKTTFAGMIALIAGAFAAHQGCGGDETTADGDCNPACGAGQECVAGQCQCAAGTTMCGGACVSTDTDPVNCGVCGGICDETEVCIGGSCQCPDGQAECSTGCADLASNPLNCGQCNVSCGSAESCVNSACSCPDGLIECFDQCVDTTSDANFCGDCNTSCEDGEFCDASTCEPISGCDDVNMDQYEGNDDCSLARPLPIANENATAVVVGDPTLHHIDGSLDTDWYSILTVEANHLNCGVPYITPQCYFGFDIAFAPPDAAAYATYQMCVYQGSCGGTETCTSAADWNAGANRYELSLSYQGTCYVNDGGDMFVKIARNGGEESCMQYALEYQFTYTDEVCPP